MRSKLSCSLELGMKMLMISGVTHGALQDLAVRRHMGLSLVTLNHLLCSNGYGVQIILENINSFFGYFLGTD
jgi:hypothetical protein